MIVDASAIVAILLDEPEARSLADRLEGAPVRSTHPISVYEAVLAVAREWNSRPAEADDDVSTFMSSSSLRVIELGPADATAAIEAFARYGKGRHPAKLNMGDCFSYAVAKQRGVPLLYKGDDFAKTDLA